MGAEMLGNEAFIDKIVRENGSLGEKILGKIIAFKEALGRIGDLEAQAVFVINKIDAELRTASMLNKEIQQRLPNNSAPNISISKNPEKSTPKAKFSLKDDGAGIDVQTEVSEDAGVEGEVSTKQSRNSTETVTLSKGQLAALRA